MREAIICPACGLEVTAQQPYMKRRHEHVHFHCAAKYLASLHPVRGPKAVEPLSPDEVNGLLGIVIE